VHTNGVTTALACQPCEHCIAYPGDLTCPTCYWTDDPKMAIREIDDAHHACQERIHEIEAHERTEEGIWQRRLEKSMMLSGGNLTICQALMRGEHVPVDQLDPVWVKRYGIRP
jgi:hypothetical protein